MKQYQDLIKEVLQNGIETENRTGIKTKSIFGYQMRFDLQKGFPAVTTKKLAWKAVVGELLWFLEGSTDERRLAELTYSKNRKELYGKNTIWTANADNQGKELGYINTENEKLLGPIYGYQWRNFGSTKWKPKEENNFTYGFDQIIDLIDQIKTNPDSRRLIISAWDANQLKDMALPPCHVMFQFRVLNNKLYCQLYQRSADVFLGVPFNIASYALLTHLIARECKLEVGDYIHTIGDAHIYENHIEQCKIVLERQPFDLPILKINNDFQLMNRLKNHMKIDDTNNFILESYTYHEKITGQMAI